MADTRGDRRLVAILAADVAGYSRLMGSNEVRTIRDLADRRAIMDQLVADYGGRVVNSVGDSVLAEFPSALSAVESAIEIQNAIATANAGLAADEGMHFRIGLHIGEVILRDGHIFGDGVNVAARLQALAEPGRIVVSELVYDQVKRKSALSVRDLGTPPLKNIQGAIKVYEIGLTRVEAGTSSKADRGSLAHVSPPTNEGTLSLPDKPSIAVLPFQNMSGDPEQDYFADGIVEDVITALSRFKSLFVIARNSSFTYKGKAVDIKQVGRELGVRYVLEGSVRKAGAKVRITGQLIEAATNNHLWAEKFDGEIEDVFDLQDKITANVVSAIEPTVLQAEMLRAKRKPTERLDSYDLFLRGLALARRWAFTEAYEYFRRAFIGDVEYAMAYAMAAEVLLLSQSLQGAILPAETRNEAIRLAWMGLRLAQDDATTIALSAHVLCFLGNEYDQAEASIEKAVTLNQNLATAWNFRGWISVICGKPERAIESFNQLLRFSPFDPSRRTIWYGMACAYSALGQHEEGCTYAARAIQDWPDLHAFGGLVINAVPAGRIDEARAAVAKILDLRPDFRVSHVPDVFRTRDAEWMARMLAAFREAGLPE